MSDGIHSDNPDTEIHIGTRVLYMGRDIGVVADVRKHGDSMPYFIVDFPTGITVLAEIYDLQNIDDKREG